MDFFGRSKKGIFDSCDEKPENLQLFGFCCLKAVVRELVEEKAKDNLKLRQADYMCVAICCIYCFC